MSIPRLKSEPPSAARRGASNLTKMLSGRLGAQVILALSVFVIARRMGSQTYGLYAGTLALVAILQAASSGGLQMVEARTLAPLWQQGKRAEALALGSTIWWTRVLLSLFTGLVAVFWLSRSEALARGLGISLLVGLFCLLRNSYEAARSLLLPVGRAGALILFELARASLTLPLVLSAFFLAGLDGVFIALPLFYALMLVACYRALGKTFPLSRKAFHWPLLRPHLGYSFSSFLGTLAGMTQAQFAVYALANWVTGSAAAYLGLAVQFFALGQGIVLTCQRALMPILAELEAEGDLRRLGTWGGRMLRYTAAASSVAMVGWALVGRDMVAWLLGEGFAPVYPCVTWILLAAIFYGLAEGCNGLLYVKGLARTAFACTLLFSLITILGLVWILRQDSGQIALEICRLYSLASAIFFLATFGCLGARGRLWLPITKVLALIAPVLAAIPAQQGHFSPLLSWLLALFWLPTYLAVAAWLGLLPFSEWRELAAIFSRKSDPKFAPGSGN